MNTLNITSIQEDKKPNNSNLYTTSKAFWKSKSAELDSMCGFSDLNEEDNLHTKNLLDNYFIKVNNTDNKNAIDIGAGIGRITFSSLYPYFDEIDLLDSNQHFLDAAKSKQEEIKGIKIKNYYMTEIQKFNFEKQYDLIFIQWVLEYVNYSDLIRFFNKVKRSLKPNGIVIIKENINIDNDGDIIISEEGSRIRSYNTYEKIYEDTGLNIVHDEVIPFKRQDIYEIKCWVLKI